MKQLLGIALLCMTLGICTATEISFSPDSGEIGKGCLVKTDIMIDAGTQMIAATDVVIETSLSFVDFVPASAFPYFLPPKAQGNIIHLVGFNTDPKHRMTGKGILGTLYLRQKDNADTDGSIKLYFKKTGDTTDTNLSVAGGVDVLDTVRNASYRFIDEGFCVDESSYDINGGIAEKSLKMLLAKIDRDQQMKQLFNRKILVAFGGLLIILIVLFIYRRTPKEGKRK